ncbi:MAG: DUF3784 domain-containing protein [Clostridiales bacterium]|nr:DUF3784 domain-containing protein [Clostridiales bacterium]
MSGLDIFVIIAVSVALTVLGVVMLTGRGSWMIAGFNTMPKEKRAGYDAAALSRFIGKILTPIGVLTALFVIEDIAMWYVWIYLAVVLGLCVFAAVYANTEGRFKR